MGSHGFKFAIGIVATAIMARLLTPQDYGLIGMAAVATNFVAMFKDLGLSHATVQRSEITSKQISTLFWVNVALSVLTMALMALIAPFVAWFYGDSRLMLVTIASATGFLFGGLAVQHEALLKRQMRFTTLSVIAVASMVVGYAIGIAFAWYGFGFWSLVFSQLGLLLTNTLLVWLTCQWLPGLPRRDSGVRSMLRFGGNITGYATVNYFSRNADALLLGKFWGPSPLGLYNKSAQLVGLPTDQINEPLTSVAIPALSRLAHDPDRYRKAYFRIMEKVLMLVMPAVALLIVASDSLIMIVLGPQWSAASPILVVMGLAALVQPVIATAGWLLVTQGRGRDMLRWSLINAPVSIGGIILGLPWGVIGVALSYSVSRIFITTPLMFWFVGKTGPIHTKDFYRLITPFSAASLVGICACLLFKYFVSVSSPIWVLVSCAGLVTAANFLVLSFLPSGRAALSDIKSSISLLRPTRSTVIVQAR